MADTPTTYTKLPGRGLRRSVFAISATRCRLWLAPDHLLAVDYTVASEEYRRFYFRDIEAFIIRRTARRQVWNWILLALILFTTGPFVIAWRSQGEGGLLIAAIGFATFWLLFLLANTLRGATCQTHIRTAVQMEELPSLARLPAARKVLARLQPLIVAAQGAATPDELTAAPWMVANVTPAPGVNTGSKPIRADKGWMHGWLFGLLIVEAILTAIAYIFFAQPISMFSMLAMLAGCIVCVVALMRQGDTDLPDAVRTVTKVTIAYYVLKCLVGFIYMMIFAVNHPGKQMVTGLEMVGEPGFAETAIGSAGLGAIIGLIGFIALLGHLRRPVAPPPAT
jgi:energy-converting hydrogenase Eha subunit C